MVGNLIYTISIQGYLNKPDMEHLYETILKQMNQESVLFFKLKQKIRPFTVWANIISAKGHLW